MNTSNKIILTAVSGEYDNLKKVDKCIKHLRSYTSNKVTFKTTRYRHIWAMKRSPHVYSKSQESFGYEVYKGNWVINLNNKDGGNVVNTVENEYLNVIGCINHILPGLGMSWKLERDRENDVKT